MQRGQEGDICTSFSEQDSASKIKSQMWVSEMQLPTVSWAMHNQILLDCCENDCCLTTNFSLQFSAAQTPVVYQISPPSGIPGTGPFFKLEPTLIIISCSILSFSLWGDLSCWGLKWAPPELNVQAHAEQENGFAWGERVYSTRYKRSVWSTVTRLFGTWFPLPE